MWMGFWTAGWMMAFLAPSYATITALTPPEGTVGTEFTITGTGFGDKRGKVDLGEENCKIVSWSETAVTCEIKKAQPAGEYAITLTPQGGKKKTVPQVYAPFMMRQPYIDESEPMRLVTPLEVVTITGDFFGHKQGLAGMRDTTGLTLECKVLDWSMNSITFQIPEGLTGTVILGVKNDFGGGHPAVLGHLHGAAARCQGDPVLLHQGDPRERDGHLLQQPALDVLHAKGPGV